MTETMPMETTPMEAAGAAGTGVRAGELLDAARRALVAWGLEGLEPVPLGAGIHHTFRVDAPGGRRVLRLYGALRDAAEVRAEHRWLDFLTQRGLAVPEPLATTEGAVSTAVPVAGEVRRAGLTAWVAGEAVDGAPAADDCRRCGELLARLHRASDHFEPPAGFRRPRYDADGLLGAAGEALPLPDGGPFTAADRESFDTAARVVRRHLEELGEDRGFGLVHGDLQVTNLVFADGRAGAIDFADFGWGWYLYDLAAVLLPLRAIPGYPRLEEALLAGYSAVRPLAADERRRLDLFVLARALFVLRWSAETWHLPAVRATGETAVPHILAQLGDMLARLQDAGEAGADAPRRGMVELFEELRQRGIRLWEEDGALRFKAATGALTGELRDELAARKPEVLAFLRRSGATASGGPRLEPVPRDRPLPLSFSQERLWVLDRLQPGGSAYNISQVVRMEGALDVASLARSLGEVVRRHESLRTRFAEGEAGPVQVVEAPAPVPLPVVDLSALGEAPRRGEGARLVRLDARRSFDLAAGPLVRFTLLRSAPRRHRLLLDVHHVVSDGWSSGVLLREVAALYPAFRAGRPSPLAELPLQYPDFAVWQRRWLSGERLEAHLRFWRDSLEGAPERLDLPTDRPRPAFQAYRGGRVPVTLDARLTSRLEAFGRRLDATPFMVTLAAFEALLHRYTGTRDLVVGTPVANRDRGELEGLIGFFVNTLALRTRLDPAAGFAGLVSAVRETAVAAFGHQELPFEKLVDELQPPRDPGLPPIFQVLFVMQNTPSPKLEMAGLEMAYETADKGSAKFDLTLSLWPDGDGLAGTLNYDAALFDEATARRMAAAYEHLLADALERPRAHLGDLAVPPPAERRRLDSFETASPPPAAAVPLDLRVAEQARRRSAGVAVTWTPEDGERRQVTYGELDAAANRLARHLADLGVAPEVRVGVLLDRSIDLVVALLAVLRAGGGYVPLDPHAPAARSRHALADSGARVLITDRAHAAGLAEAEEDGGGRLAPDLRLVHLDGDAEEIAAHPATPPPAPWREAAWAADRLAYVIYTSGSTGRPKGVAVSHRQVAELLAAPPPAYRFTDADVGCLFHSHAFDVSVWELWGALTAGARLVVVPHWVSRTPRALRRLLADDGVTALSQTPSAFLPLIRAEAEMEEEGEEAGELALERVILAGEALDFPSLAPWVERHGDAAPHLLNMYGPTETTVYATLRRVRAGDVMDGGTGGGSRGTAPSLIGPALDGSALAVADRRLRRVPLGAVGELCIRGPGVTRGYLGRPALTAERFVPDPFSDLPGARLYRSGDLARRRPDGDVEFLGRLDQQVQVRGFRVELGEIETALTSAGGVAAAAILARRPEEAGAGLRLVAFLVPEGEAPPLAELRAGLARRLPEYMIPAEFVVLDALPLNASGKLDRRALEAMGGEILAPGGEHVEPRTDLERSVAAMWEELLDRDGVGAEDDFFALGGNSLLATQVASRIRRDHGVDLPLAQFFEAPTVAALASAVEVVRRAEEDLRRATAGGESEDAGEREVGEL